jgi:hypothetical protein
MLVGFGSAFSLLTSANMLYYLLICAFCEGSVRPPLPHLVTCFTTCWHALPDADCLPDITGLRVSSHNYWLSAKHPQSLDESRPHDRRPEKKNRKIGASLHRYAPIGATEAPIFLSWSPSAQLQPIAPKPQFLTSDARSWRPHTLVA